MSLPTQSCQGLKEKSLLLVTKTPFLNHEITAALSAYFQASQIERLIAQPTDLVRPWSVKPGLLIVEEGWGGLDTPTLIDHMLTAFPEIPCLLLSHGNPPTNWEFCLLLGLKSFVPVENIKTQLAAAAISAVAEHTSEQLDFARFRVLDRIQENIQALGNIQAFIQDIKATRESFSPEVQEELDDSMECLHQLKYDLQEDYS